MYNVKLPISVLGAGSWGTALALQFARSKRGVRMWGRDEKQIRAMGASRCNDRYLPDAVFPDNLQVCTDLETCVQGVQDILVSVPSHALRETLARLTPLLESDARVCWATKGFELSTGKLPHQVAQDVLGMDRPMAVLSGPTFAKEVGDGLPTAMTIAANVASFSDELARSLSDEYFRAYT